MKSTAGELSVQIFAGDFAGDWVSWETVEQKLLTLIQKVPVHKVIIGWPLDKKFYEKAAMFLAKHAIEFYLWFPVFSETGTLRTQGPLVDIHGKQIEDRTNEGFAFFCPNNPRNIENIIDIFESEFDTIPFTGVFLDRIRFPSFAQKSGHRSVFSCFCPHCLEIYNSENFNIKKLEIALTRSSEMPLGITAYKGNGKYEFEDSTILQFFTLKENIIFRNLSKICHYFREKNYKIGFDVFAPFLSPFVGQNLKALSGLCDFMKPMMYRATKAPAGLPFETEALLCEGGISGQKTALYPLLGIDPKQEHFDLAFTVQELKDLTATSVCPVYAGVEINRVKDLAEVYPSYIEETIKAYTQSGICGIALSWNLLDTPEENITHLFEIFGLKTIKSPL
jgi:hypothetical protein